MWFKDMSWLLSSSYSSTNLQIKHVSPRDGQPLSRIGSKCVMLHLQERPVEECTTEKIDI